MTTPSELPPKENMDVLEEKSFQNKEATEQDVYEYAKLYLRIGLSVIPLRVRGKEPIIKWKKYQETLPSEATIRRWFRGKNQNIAIVTGSISGNLVVIDFDNEEKFKEFIAKVKQKEKLAEIIANTWVVRTGKGYHVYLRINIEPSEFKKMFRTKPRLIEGVDIKAEGGYVVAPPSIHPSGKRYEFVRNEKGVFGPPENPEPIAITEEEWKQILALLGVREERPSTTRQSEIIGLRSLNDSAIVKIKEMLKEAYRPSYRQFICLFLSGWSAKAKINPVSIAKIIKMLYDETNDEDPLKMRLSTIVYSYKKTGLWNQEIEEALRRQFSEWGIDRVSGLENLINEQEVKGKSGLQEILEQVVGEERALEIIREIEDTFGAVSPFRDSVTIITDLDNNKGYTNHMRLLRIYQVRRENNRIELLKVVWEGAITNLTVYLSQFGRITKYEIVWESRARPKPMKIGPATLEEIYARLRAEGFMAKTTLGLEALSNIINAFIIKKGAEIKEEIEGPGFYLVDGKVKAVKWEPGNITREQLKEALELLDELATKWFNHIQERFATVIKWYVVAPFSYIFKQLKKWMPWLYQYGPPDTGKSTQNKIGASIWGQPLIEKSGAGASSPARLEQLISESTFPVMVKEPAEMFQSEAVIEMIKAAAEDVLARGKVVKGTYVETPALAPLTITSNSYLPKDPGLVKRFLIILYTFNEVVPKEKQDMFKEKIQPRLGKLVALGKWIAAKIIDNPALLEKNWKELSTTLLKEAYMEAGLEPPKWIELWWEGESEQDVYEYFRETIRVFLVKRINEEYTRFVGRVTVPDWEHYREDFLPRHEVSFEDRVRIVLQEQLLGWAVLKGDKVYFTTGVLNELNKIISNIGNLKNLAEILGWNYKEKENFTIGGRKVNRSVMYVNLRDFIDFLNTM